MQVPLERAAAAPPRAPRPLVRAGWPRCSAPPPVGRAALPSARAPRHGARARRASRRARAPVRRASGFSLRARPSGERAPSACRRAPASGERTLPARERAPSSTVRAPAPVVRASPPRDVQTGASRPVTTSLASKCARAFRKRRRGGRIPPCASRIRPCALVKSRRRQCTSAPTDEQPRGAPGNPSRAREDPGPLRWKPRHRAEKPPPHARKVRFAHAKPPRVHAKVLTCARQPAVHSGNTHTPAAQNPAESGRIGRSVRRYARRRVAYARRARGKAIVFRCIARDASGNRLRAPRKPFSTPDFPRGACGKSPSASEYHSRARDYPRAPMVYPTVGRAIVAAHPGSVCE